MRILSERIRQLRETRGMTQDDLSIRLGISRSTLANYESGRREPDLETLFALARQLRTSVAYLIGEIDEVRPPISQTIPGVTDQSLSGFWMNDILIRVNFVRDRNGIDLEDLITKHGISINDLKKLNEVDADNADLAIVQRVALALNTTMSFLLGHTDDPSPLPGVAVAHHDPEKGVEPGEPMPPETQLIVEQAVLDAKKEWGWSNRDNK